MKLLRISASLIALSMVSALAACGGGGGGGGSTPPVGNPPPGGSPAPTATPAPSPTSSSTPPPSGIGVSSVILNAADGYTNGTDNWQSNGATANGDTGDGDTSTGGTGSNTVDGVSCSLPNGEATGAYYHQHAFVGIMVNGTEYAMPDAVGMVNPDSNEPIVNFQCAYNIHTHAASGIVHVEDPSLSPTAAAPAQYNLQTLFDIWGQSMSALSINGASGAPAIYVGSHISTRSCSCAQNGDDVVDQYSPATGAASSLLLTHHAAYWLVYGTPPAAGLPQVDFGIE